jgi:hypothetical protein
VLLLILVTVEGLPQLHWNMLYGQRRGTKTVREIIMWEQSRLLIGKTRSLREKIQKRHPDCIQYTR